MKYVKTILIALAACSITLPTAASAGSPSGAGVKAYSIQPQTGSRVPVPDDEPTIIEVVRPERTIVRDVDEALPLIVSGTALVLVLASTGLTLLRTRVTPRPRNGS